MNCSCNAGRCGVDHEYKLAACDVKRNSIAYGIMMSIELHQEDTITRDRYGSIINRRRGEPKRVPVPALPLEYSPTDKQKTNAGIRENTDIIAWTPKLCWDEADIAVKDLNTIKANVVVNNETYEIVDKALKSQFGVDFLYVTIGLNKI